MTTIAQDYEGAFRGDERAELRQTVRSLALHLGSLTVLLPRDDRYTEVRVTSLELAQAALALLRAHDTGDRMTPTLGRIVHVRFPTGYTCPAIVVRAFPENVEVVNVYIFTDGPFASQGPGVRPDGWHEHVQQGDPDVTRPSTVVWFWPPRTE